jgi:hypothetical protein
MDTPLTRGKFPRAGRFLFAGRVHEEKATPKTTAPQTRATAIKTRAENARTQTFGTNRCAQQGEKISRGNSASSQAREDAAHQKGETTHG